MASIFRKPLLPYKVRLKAAISGYLFVHTFSFVSSRWKFFPQPIDFGNNRSLTCSCSIPRHARYNHLLCQITTPHITTQYINCKLTKKRSYRFNRTRLYSCFNNSRHFFKPQIFVPYPDFSPYFLTNSCSRYCTKSPMNSAPNTSAKLAPNLPPRLRLQPKHAN